MPTIYSLEHGVGFVHIPKCAGSTVSTNLVWGPDTPNALEEKMAADWNPNLSAEGSAARYRPHPGAHGWKKMGDVPGMAEILVRNNLGRDYNLLVDPHSRACDLRDAVGPEAYAQMEVFSVVRDPLLRLESTYHYIRDRRENGRHALVKPLDFEEFVWWHCAEAYQPQHEWLTDTDGRVIVDRILRPEELNAYVMGLLKRLFDTDRPLVRSNRSTNARLAPFSSAARLSHGAYVRFIETYARDYALLGYPVPPYEELTGRRAPTEAETEALVAAIPAVIADPAAAAADLGLDVETLEWRLRALSGGTMLRFLTQELGKARSRGTDLLQTLQRHRNKIAYLEAQLAKARGEG